MKLNLGASDRHLDGFLCVDLDPSPCAVCGMTGTIQRQVDLSYLWPWRTSSVEEVQALDVIEHVGDASKAKHRLPKNYIGIQPPDHIDWHFDSWNRCRKSGRIHFMNELHRVLVPGGRATIETPDASRGSGYWQDPTHVSPWTANSFQYFGAGPGGDFAYGRLSKAYGITGRFKMISIDNREYQDSYDKVWKLTAVLECVK